MKLLTVIGARPQFVKAAMVSRALHARPNVHEVLVHTGQHFDETMSGVFFEELGLPRPDYDLGVNGGSHGAMTGRMLVALDPLYEAERPDWTLVYGDTNSTLAGALASAKMGVPVAHVEAGMRSFDRAMPEEINRVVTDRLSTLFLAATETAVQQLLREGVADSAIHRVGDVMYDAVRALGAAAEARAAILSRLGVAAGSFILATVHRAANTDDDACLRHIWQALGAAAHATPVVVPLHPRTRAALERAGLTAAGRGPFIVIEPVGYLDMLVLERNARLVVTDSGGVQKEAFFFGVPCLTLRAETEWTELVASGWNRLVPPTDEARIQTAIADALAAGRPDSRPELFGDGHAAERIVDVLTAQRRAS